MKSKIIVIFVLVVNIFANAQTNNKKYELSFSGTIGAFKSSLETSEAFSYTSESELMYYLISNIRFGYYLNRNFEIEPELQFALYEGADPSYSVNANILYNFDIDSSKIKPFLLVGYGLGNSVPFFNTLLGPRENSPSVNQLNAGLGTKIILDNSIAIRIEYRFQLYKSEEELSNNFNPPLIHNYSYYMHNILFGISLLL